MPKILTFDGGGIKGVIPAAIISEIERRTKKRASELFDLFAGTSTGAIIALALAKKEPLYAYEVLDLYNRHGADIFNRSLFHKIKTLFGMLGPKYPADGLTNTLSQYFGDSKLSECIKSVVIPTFNLTEEKPYFFSCNKNLTRLRTFHYNSVVSLNQDYPLTSVIRATTAAPTYFAPCEIGNSLYIDGGIFANDPSICAVVEAMLNWPGEEIKLVSLGCGSFKLNSISSTGWGLVRWAVPLSEIAFSAGLADYQCRQLVKNYWRFQAEIPADLKMDKISDVSRLKAIAEDFIVSNNREINNICSMLTS